MDRIDTMLEEFFKPDAPPRLSERLLGSLKTGPAGLEKLYGFILDGVTTARPPALALTPSAPGESCANTWRAGARSSRWRSTSAASGSFSPACWPKPSAFRSARSIPIRPSRDGWAIRAPPARSATRSGPTRCR